MASLFDFFKRKKKESRKKEKGTIARYYENDLPVILKFNDEFPEESIRLKYPKLTVISWKYKDQSQNGIPLPEINKKMIDLEEAVDKTMNKTNKYQHAYSRTGNNLKELVYYGTSQDEFMDLLNKTLAKHERYPIDIEFYDDPEWSEFKKLLEDLKRT